MTNDEIDQAVDNMNLAEVLGIEEDHLEEVI
jgi:hypothetical protein